MNSMTPSMIAAIVLAILGMLLLRAAWTDVKSRRIPNGLVLVGACVGVACNCMLPEGSGFAGALPGGLGLQGSLAGIAMGMGVMLPLYLLRAMGAGDVKLMAMVGAFLGARTMFGVVLATFIAGGVLGLGVALYGGTLRKLLDNVRTMLLSGFFKMAMHEMPVMDAAPATAGKLPYALAIALGTGLCLALRHAGFDPAGGFWGA